MNEVVPFARRLRAGGVDVAAYETGPAGAPVVLLLHGLGHWTEAAWSKLVPHLDRARRYVAFDLPGFGASERPAVRYDAAFFRRVVDDVVAALEVPRCALVGHSLGGWIAADWAGTHPERVSHLGLIAPAGFSRVPRHIAFSALARIGGGLFAARTPSRRFVTRILERAVADTASIDPAHLERAYELAQELAVRRAFAGVYAGAANLVTELASVHAAFARYSGPVFCAWGRHDRYIPIASLRDVVRVYPHATTLILEHSAHLPTIEEPATLGTALRDFLRS